GLERVTVGRLALQFLGDMRGQGENRLRISEAVAVPAQRCQQRVEPGTHLGEAAAVLQRMDRLADALLRASLVDLIAELAFAGLAPHPAVPSPVQRPATMPWPGMAGCDVDHTSAPANTKSAASKFRFCLSWFGGPGAATLVNALALAGGAGELVDGLVDLEPRRDRRALHILLAQSRDARAYYFGGGRSVLGDEPGGDSPDVTINVHDPRSNARREMKFRRGNYTPAGWRKRARVASITDCHDSAARSSPTSIARAARSRAKASAAAPYFSIRVWAIWIASGAWSMGDERRATRRSCTVAPLFWRRRLDVEISCSMDMFPLA